MIQNQEEIIEQNDTIIEYQGLINQSIISCMFILAVGFLILPLIRTCLGGDR